MIGVNLIRVQLFELAFKDTREDFSSIVVQQMKKGTSMAHIVQVFNLRFGEYRHISVTQRVYCRLLKCEAEIMSGLGYMYIRNKVD